ncbi:MAG: M20/M25/M40 family metallo-hydrolase [Acidobacteria bacterium]|nr:M20/M25/M40 family metallo-hydrolase [Acidobacteriota bacterium]
MSESVAELANVRGIRECIQWFTREKHWINEQHLALCRVPAPTFLEEKRAEWMASQFRMLGCEARLDRGGNVIATLAPVREGPFVAVTAHLDTVLAPRHPEEISVSPDGRILGPGVADNGAGLAALLALAAAMKASPSIEGVIYPLLFIANVGEEGEGNLSGMRFLVKQSPLGSKISAFLVLDGPSTDHITCQALASRRYEISFTGPGGHSWNDYGMANPVHAISRAVALFAEHRTNGRANEPRSSYNFGTIEGGTSINSIPTQARAKLDIRSEDPDRIDKLSDLLTASVERARDIENERSVGGRVAAKVREIGSRPGGGLREDAKILPYLRSVDTFLGIRSFLDCASTDANIPLSMGLSAVSIGAGGQGGGAHTPAEWYHPEGRELALKRTLLTLALLMRDPETASPAR